MKKYFVPIALFALVLASGPVAAQDYPLRQKYPDEKFITTAELLAAGADAIIIDTRDLTEFNVVHIEGAKLLPVEKLKESDLLGVREKQGAKKLVFYCNGVLCEKSYKATQMARLWGFQNTFVYDAGIFDWAKTQPEKSLFFDKPLTKDTVATSLISKDKFEAACLAPDAFKARTADAAFKVFDIRDRSDRAAKQVKFKDDVGANMDEFVGFLEKGVVVPKEKILIYDNVGKQVVWLQYYLEKFGIKDYYFLKGGVKALGQ
jgi:rhodanese-related sulfurtransferase